MIARRVGWAAGGKEGAGWPSRRWRAEDGADTGIDTFWRSAMASDILS